MVELIFEIQEDVGEVLVGENEKEKTIALVEWFDRRERLNELIALCRKLRPLVEW